MPHLVDPILRLYAVVYALLVLKIAAVGSYTMSGNDASLTSSGSNGGIFLSYFATGTRTNGVITQYGSTFDQLGGTVTAPR